MAGVSAATGAISSILIKLAGLLNGEYKLLKGVRKEIEFLQRELGTMEALLQKLADKEVLDPMERNCRDNIRELSFDLEDCIDHFMHHLGSGDEQSGFMKRTLRRLKKLRVRHQIAGQIQDLKDRVTQERDRLKLLDNCTSSSETVHIDPRVPALYTNTRDLVAIEEQRDKIVGLLMEEKVELKVVSIVGCGGLGKTTLAMEVYNKIKGDFQCHASVSVSRTLDLEKLLRDMLYQIDSHAHQQSERWEKDQLRCKLRELLMAKRYIIVVDDIWSTQHWEFVKSSLPDNDNCSRIITTTRIREVAESCCSSPGDEIHKMAPLKDADSEKLFCKRVFGSDNHCPPQLEEVSKRILKKCGGLPLAIITIASLLVHKPLIKEQWENVLDSIGSAVKKGTKLDDVKNILYLSYCDLPYILKTCLLYLSTYPEDDFIDRKNLVLKWIAEGFITEQRGQKLEQTAENYLNELVNRSFIEPGPYDYDGKPRFFRVHDIMLDLIIELASEQNFVTIIHAQSECNAKPDRARRLSLQSNRGKHPVKQVAMKFRSHIRSVSTFGRINQIPYLGGCKALRVLDFDNCPWLENHHIRNIGDLVQLKYLRLSGARITELPHEIGCLQYLETLDVRYCHGLRQLPSAMVRLLKLVRLYVSPGAILPDEVGNMQSLEELSGAFNCHNPDIFVEHLVKLTKLRDLDIGYGFLVENCNNKERCNKIFVPSLCELGRHCLRRLAIGCELPILDLVMSSGSLADLKGLTMHKYDRVTRLPKGMASLVNLIELKMKAVITIGKEDIHSLAGLPVLHHLYLDMSEGLKEMVVVGRQGFPLLENLFMCSRNGSCKGLLFEPGAMPALQTLEICYNAKVLSSTYGSANGGIGHLSNLRDLSVTICCREATAADVEAAEHGIRSATSLLPNCSSITIERWFENEMVKEHDNSHCAGEEEK
ncbi:hypothetical protein ACP70R_022801 [Stipagrostis hirtigluma subsp. patula]